jgi:hypothetical protein
MYEYCKPGEKILKSGIYRVRHDQRCISDHDVTCVFGKIFPRCNKCGDAPHFSLVRYAADVETHEFFSLRSRNPGNPYRRPWTDEESVRLRQLLAEGRTVKEAAEELGRSRSAVKMRARRAGLPS